MKGRVVLAIVGVMLGIGIGFIFWASGYLGRIDDQIKGIY